MKRLFCVCLICAFFSCRKNTNESFPENCGPAKIEFSDPAADGFGWVIELPDGTTLVPKQLNEEFKKEDISVNVCYRATGEKAACRCFNPPAIVEIINISLR